MARQWYIYKYRYNRMMIYANKKKKKKGELRVSYMLYIMDESY